MMARKSDACASGKLPCSTRHALEHEQTRVAFAIEQAQLRNLEGFA